LKQNKQSAQTLAMPTITATVTEMTAQSRLNENS